MFWKWMWQWPSSGTLIDEIYMRQPYGFEKGESLT